MNIGTRVYHRRYSWLVGRITHVREGGMVTVHWGPSDHIRDEYISDIRATPVQP